MKLSQLQSKYNQVVATIKEFKLINSQKDGQIAERNEHIRILQEECADFKDQVLAIFFLRTVRFLLDARVELLLNMISENQPYRRKNSSKSFNFTLTFKNLFLNKLCLKGVEEITKITNVKSLYLLQTPDDI